MKFAKIKYVKIVKNFAKNAFKIVVDIDEEEQEVIEVVDNTETTEEVKEETE